MTNISTYITWWNWLELKTNAQVENAKQLQVHYAAMRQRSVTAKWAELKEAFVQYTEKVRHFNWNSCAEFASNKVLSGQIERLEDTHPELFGSFKDSAQTPVSSSDLSNEYIQHHSENPRPKTSSKFGGLLRVISLKGFFSHFRVKQNSVMA